MWSLSRFVAWLRYNLLLTGIWGMAQSTLLAAACNLHAETIITELDSILKDKKLGT